MLGKEGPVHILILLSDTPHPLRMARESASSPVTRVAGLRSQLMPGRIKVIAEILQVCESRTTVVGERSHGRAVVGWRMRIVVDIGELLYLCCYRPCGASTFKVAIGTEPLEG